MKNKIQGKFKSESPLLNCKIKSSNTSNEIESKCHIPSIVHAFPCIENCGLNLVSKLAKPPTCKRQQCHFRNKNPQTRHI